MDHSQSLRNLIEELAARGDRPAVLALRKEGRDQWSAGKLGTEATRLARALRSAGMESGDRAVFMGGSSPQWVAGLLAVLKCGGVAVPLDTELREETLQRVLDDTAPKWIFATSRHARRLERLGRDDLPGPILLDAPGIEDGDNDRDGRSWRDLQGDEDAEFPDVKPDDPAVLFYTSGTTGPPKGVPLSHRNLLFQLAALRDSGLTREDDRVLVPLPLHHVYPLVIGILVPLSLDLPIVFPYGITGPELVRAVREGEASIVIGVPRLYVELRSGIESRTVGAGKIAHGAFRSALATARTLHEVLHLPAGRVLFRRLHRRFGHQLRVLASGGAALDPGIARDFEAMGWQVATGYGLTETSPLLTLNLPGESRKGTAGRALNGVELKIAPQSEDGSTADSEHPPDSRPDTIDGAQSDSAGEKHTDDQPHEGEILARSPGVFDGYRNLPDRTQESMTDDGWFRTGDLGYLDDDGFLHVTGRVSTLIITEQGEKVQPDEIEDVCASAEAIREAGVLEDDGRLVAVVVPETPSAGGDRSDDAELDQSIRQAMDGVSRELPSWQRISDYVISHSRLPRTRLGKIRRHELQELYEQICEDSRESEPQSGQPVSLEEMSPDDQRLLQDPAAGEVWSLLTERYSEQRLTPDSDLQLVLGVDSMQWLNLSLDIQRRAQVELTDEMIQDVDRVRDLLEQVSRAEGSNGNTGPDPLEEPRKMLSEVEQRWLEPLSVPQRAAARALETANRLMMKSVFRLQVAGRENLPQDRQFVLVPDHTSHLDPMALSAALGSKLLRRTCWAGFTGAVFGNRLMRGISRLTRTVPISGEHSAASSLAFAAAVLESGQNLVWFAEGRRSQSGELLEFLPGIGMLLSHFRIPAIPMHVAGGHRAMPVGRRIPRPHRMSVIFGEPVEPSQMPRQSEEGDVAREIAALLHDRVAELARENSRVTVFHGNGSGSKEAPEP